MGLNSSQRLRRKPSVISRQEDEHVLLYDENDGTLFMANDVGGFVWNVIDEGVDVAAIVTRLHTAFPDEDVARIELDLAEFLQPLISLGWVESVAPVGQR
jgi:hypothetical protein